MLQCNVLSTETVVCYVCIFPMNFIVDMLHNSANGRTAFYGTPQRCIEFFDDCGHSCPDSYNPADMIIHALAMVPHDEDASRSSITAICDAFESGYTLDNWRNPALARAKLMQKIIMGLFIGLLYLQTPLTELGILNIMGALFLLTGELTYPTLFGILTLLPSDYQLVVKEYHDGMYYIFRYTLDNWRNPALARAKLMQKIVMGLFIGLLYLQVSNALQQFFLLICQSSAIFKTPLTELGILNIMGALFLLTGELTYPTLFGILTLLPSDYQLVVKEYHDGMYYIFSYYIARILSYIPLFTIDGFLMVYICYWMIGLSSSLSQILLATLISFLIEQSAVAFGVMMSSIFTFHVAASISGPILVLLLLSGGFLAKISTLPSYIGWVQYLSWFRYGFEAFAINQWSHVNGDNTTWSEQRSQEILAHFSFKERNFWFDIMMMTAFTLIFYLIGYIGLCLRVMNAG
ncbi:unnamed protein product [Nippostrongylus brasiliensis]|uniref:ABC2_membrane domain-containing protein n=1 Tax=Nippostrongylus brasiliensis TaxID=27835 RepID=A0A0N4YMK2_NIPBR|nr:unnamed protein product [Nippostrongylus brasiliensis]